MASLIPPNPALQHEIEEQFTEIQVDLVHCDLCGEYHPPELHLTRCALLDDEDTRDA
jgi:hypothetical protein